METIGNTREYFDKVVDYNLQQYTAQPTNLAAAFNLANALFHLHEWLWHDYKNKLEIKFEKKFKEPEYYNNFVQEKCNAFKHIRDLANASKHVKLTRNPSTNADSITDTHAIKGSYVEDGYVEDGYVESEGIYINDGGDSVNFKDCADEVYEYWRNLLFELNI